MDADAIRAAIPREPIAGSVAADRIAVALGTPHPTGYGERANVTAFVVRRLIARGLLTELSGNPEGSLVNPDHVDAVCQREDLADLVAANTPRGPDQAAERLRVRRVEFDPMRTLGWIKPTEWREVRYGTSRAGAVDVPMFTTAAIDALPGAHPEVSWEQLAVSGKAGAPRSPPW
jgi:hypothetical protein